MNTYTIYLLNQSAELQTFWCFLAPPQELQDNPGVYANSSVSLAVRSNDQSTNTFVIPVQYKVGAGASNQAVGLKVQIQSNALNNASLGDTWSAGYVTVPPNEGPTLTLVSNDSQGTTITIVTNTFDQVVNQDAHWYSNQSFGIETEAGFLGMTWSPAPGQQEQLTPTLTFYVATGSFGSNSLASWDTISTSSAIIPVATSFANEACTVTYTSSGEWTVAAGPPPQLSLASTQNDTVSSVIWGTSSSNADTGNTYLTGTLSVGAALAAAFTTFVLSGVTFNIQSAGPGQTTFNFSYSGSQSAQAIKSLFTAGAKILLQSGTVGGRGNPDSGQVS